MDPTPHTPIPPLLVRRHYTKTKLPPSVLNDNKTQTPSLTRNAPGYLNMEIYVRLPYLPTHTFGAWIHWWNRQLARLSKHHTDPMDRENEISAGTEAQHSSKSYLGGLRLKPTIRFGISCCFWRKRLVSRHAKALALIGSLVTILLLTDECRWKQRRERERERWTMWLFIESEADTFVVLFLDIPLRHTAHVVE